MVKLVARLAKILIPAIIALFVCRVIYQNWQQVRAADWEIQPLYLLLSFLLCSPWFVMRPLGWNIILNRFGRTIPFVAVYRVCRQAELSRYVPGGVWQFLSRVYLINKWEVTASACLAATVVDLVLATLAAVVPALWTLSAVIGDFGTYHRLVLATFPLLSIVVVHPKIFNWWVGLIAAGLKQPYTPLEIGWLSLLGIWSLYVAGWVSMCAGVALFAHAILTLDSTASAFIASSYAVSWLIGTLTMIAPAGMGVRDGALGLLLSRVLAAGPAFTLAVAVRFWLILVELCWYGLGLLLPNPEPANAEESPAT